MASSAFPLSTNFDPAFGDAAEKLRAAAAAQGITTHYESGVRSKDDQAQLYANWQAGKAGRPLPYPARGPVPLAAVPGTSMHEKGLAADIVADDPAQQAKLRGLGAQFGLRTLGTRDPDHFELAAANIPKGGGSPGTFAYGGGGTPPDGATATAYAGPTPSPAASSPAVAAINTATHGTTINAARAPVAGALASPYGNPFLDKLAQIESNNRNIPSTVDKDYPGQPGSKSQGFFQIDTPTWLQFAAANGIDTKQYPNAMSAPPDVQAQVASSIPLSRFGPRTQKMLGQQFGTLDKSATIGALASNVATPTAPGPADPSAVARGSTVNPPVDGSATAVASAAPAPPLTAPEQSLWGRFTQGPIDPATGKPDPNKPSPMAAIADAIIKSPQTEKAKEEAEAPERSALSQQGPGARNVGPMGGIAATANPQTYGQTLNSFSQPLAWNDAPPQAPTLPTAGLQPTLGGQAPGMTLNSFRLPQGLGYGIDPNLGYGSLGVGYG